MTVLLLPTSDNWECQKKENHKTRPIVHELKMGLGFGGWALSDTETCQNARDLC